jgi:hypothetical protein
MKKDSKEYQEFKMAVHGWAFANENGLSKRIKEGKRVAKSVTDPFEKTMADALLKGMSEHLPKEKKANDTVVRNRVGRRRR